MKYFATLILVTGLFATASGQSLNIHTKDGGKTSIPLSQIDSLTFTLPSPPDTGSLGPLHDPVLAYQFNETAPFHRMSITWDGMYFYTINGGSASSGEIRSYDSSGNPVDTFLVRIDGRGLKYNFPDQSFYSSVYTGDIVRIESLEDNLTTIIHDNLMKSGQASFDISPDGTKLYNFTSGTLYIHDFFDGSIIDTLTGIESGSGANNGSDNVKVDGEYIYTWNSTTKTVYVYSNDGEFIQPLTVPSGSYGYSLSIAKGYLFVADDGAPGTWYGYNIRHEADATTGKINLTLEPVPSISIGTDTSR